MSLITFSSSDDAVRAVEADRLCRKIGSVLQRSYPNRRWRVDVSLVGGVARILCPSISERHGYTIHIHNKTVDQIETATRQAGGQILEMFRLSRERGAQGGEERLIRDPRGEVLQALTGI